MRVSRHPSVTEIKINQKKTTKGHDPTFSKEKHKVAATKDGEYYIPNYHKQKPWNRHELLLVCVYVPFQEFGI